MLVPGLNLLLVLAMHDFLLFILVFFAFPIVWIGCLVSAYFGGDPFRVAVERLRDTWLPAQRGILLAFLPTVVPFCGNALIITVLEGTMRVNRPFLTPGEAQWQFSQTLALGLTIVQLYDASGVLHKAWKNRSDYPSKLRECSAVNI